MQYVTLYVEHFTIITEALWLNRFTVHRVGTIVAFPALMCVYPFSYVKSYWVHPSNNNSTLRVLLQHNGCCAEREGEGTLKTVRLRTGLD